MNSVFEKIIEKLEEKQDIFLYDDSDYGEGKYNAFDEAIEIVKQEATEYEECYKDCGECEAYDKKKHHCPKFCKVITEAVKEIEENHNGWIACSERLPETYTVLCCDKYGEMLVGHPYFDEVSNTNYSAESDNEMMYNCIAWKPLPEPYQNKS